MKVLIVTGGISSERKISLLSAKNVSDILKETGHEIKLFDLKKGYPLLKKIAKAHDVVFPILHGEEGEGGSLQQFLLKIKIPYVGGDPKGFKKGWYKIPFKKWVVENNILTSEWKPVKNKKDILKFGFPSVFKSSSGGSSREVIILKSEDDLKNKNTEKLLKSKEKLFVEKFLPGVEITVGILENNPLPVLEIVPPKGGWFDYQNKYSGATREIPNAPSVDIKSQKEVQKIASYIHKSFNLGQISRINFIISGRKPYVLEINTIPGLTSESLFPKAAKAAGISFPDLLEKLVKSALKNGKKPLVHKNLKRYN